MLITVQRDRKTKDGIFGELTLENNTFHCYTVENLKTSILPGTYDVIIDQSVRFGRLMPHIIVPLRDNIRGGYGLAGIRIHWANYPKQLEGCIAVGDQEEPNAVNNSKKTFNTLYSILYANQKGLKIQIIDPVL